MRGECLCGGVAVTLTARVADVNACHCDTCRRWCSGPWLGLPISADVTIVGESLKVYRSSSFAERGFCGTCGANIFYRMRDGPEIEVSAGLFKPGEMRLVKEIFHDAKPTFYAFGGDTEKRTRVAVMLEYAPRLIARRLRRLFGSSSI